MSLKEKFDALDASEQWPFVISLSEDEKKKILIRLDNDLTSINFDIEDAITDEDGDVIEFNQETDFKEYIGDSDGVIILLSALGINAEQV